MKYQSMAFMSFGFASQSMPSTFPSKANVCEPSPRLVFGDSSMIAHPARDTIPSSKSGR